jgi:glycosyltransferase involved in cell wall biosynthesis
VAENIKLLGIVNPEEIPAWMQASDIFVLPTYHEGMPNSVMEAMACGLPVISTLVGGLPAAVGDCEGVLLAHPKNTNELQSAMVKIINSQELRLQMSQASRERAERCFGLEANTGRLLKCIEKTIENYNLTKCHDRRLK